MSSGFDHDYVKQQLGLIQLYQEALHSRADSTISSFSHQIFQERFQLLGVLTDIERFLSLRSPTDQPLEILHELDDKVKGIAQSLLGVSCCVEIGKIRHQVNLILGDKQEEDRLLVQQLDALPLRNCRDLLTQRFLLREEGRFFIAQNLLSLSQSRFFSLLPFFRLSLEEKFLLACQIVSELHDSRLKEFLTHLASFELTLEQKKELFWHSLETDFYLITSHIHLYEFSEIYLEQIAQEVVLKYPYRYYSRDSFPISHLLCDKAALCLSEPYRVWDEEKHRFSSELRDFEFFWAEEFLKEVPKEKSVFLIQFLGVLSLMCSYHGIHHSEIESSHQFFSSLFRLKHPQLRFDLASLVVISRKNGRYEEILQLQKDLIELKGAYGSQKSRDLIFLLGPLLIDYPRDVAQEIASFVLNNKNKKDSARYIPIITLLSCLKKMEFLPLSCKLYYLRLITSSEMSIAEKFNNVVYLNIIFTNQWMVNDRLDSKDLLPFIEKKFKESVGLEGEVEGFNEKFSKTFAQSRRPTAIYTYASKMKSAPFYVSDLLGVFVKSVLNGDFASLRIQEEGNPHLLAIFSQDPDLKGKWSCGEQVPLVSLEPSLVGYEGYLVVDTDDWQDLLLCGTEIVGSCQRVDGVYNETKSLLAYLLDGKNRMVAIKDHQGRLVAKRMIRLLWDDVAYRPVLFQERRYANPGVNESMEKALDQMVLNRARAMSLLLFEGVSDFDPERLDYIPLLSLSSPVPFEYFDSAGGVRSTSEPIEVKGALVASSLISVERAHYDFDDID